MAPSLTHNNEVSKWALHRLFIVGVCLLRNLNMVFRYSEIMRHQQRIS